MIKYELLLPDKNIELILNFGNHTRHQSHN